MPLKFTKPNELLLFVRSTAKLMENLQLQESQISRVSMAILMQNGTCETCLVATRKDGKDVFMTRRVRFGVVRITKGRLSLLDDITSFAVRDDRDREDEWNDKLRGACTALGVSPVYLQQLHPVNSEKRR